MRSIFVRETRNKFFCRSLFFTFIMLFIMAGRTAAQEKTVTNYADPASVPPDLPITLKHLTAYIRFQPEQNRVIGMVDFTFLPNRYQPDSIVFQAPDFNISSVTVNSQPVKFHQTGGNLVIEPGYGMRGTGYGIRDKEPAIVHPTSRIEISYTATPLAGAIYFIGWKPEEKGKRREIWAHRPTGWIPYMDGRITVDMYITFDKKCKVFSNGERMEVTDNPEGTRTWHYSMKKDHPFFSTALVIGDYDYKTSKTSRGIPLEYWYYPDQPDRVGPTYKYTEKMFDFLENEIGFQYPYPVYREAPVIDYMYGAMETTTSTVFGDYMLIDSHAWWQRNYVNVNAHELAHQWFGNCIAHFVNRDVWLTESFATYYAKMFEKSIYGNDYYQNIRNDELNMVFDAAKKNSYPVGGSQGGVQRIYQKGSLVLEMLRDVMGDREFKDAIRHYVEKYAFGYAETNDLVRCIYEATGKPFNWFFDEWILHGGEPEYKVSDSIADDPGPNSSIRFKVWQVQEVNELKGLFKMPILFEVYYKDGSRDSLRVWIEKKYTEVSIPNPARKQVDFMLFDPGRKVLKKVTFERHFTELESQAIKAVNMIDRYDAWLALRATPVKDKRELLSVAYHKETFSLIKSEILEQLGEDQSPDVVDIFREALDDMDANVRKSALKSMTRVPGMLQGTVEHMLSDSSYLNVELALGDLCSSFPDSKEHYLDLTKEMQGWRGINIRMKWLEIVISGGNQAFLPELINYCSPEFEFETRMNAFNLLKKLKYSDPKTKNFAETASKHWNNKLSSAATEYLKQLKIEN